MHRTTRTLTTALALAGALTLAACGSPDTDPVGNTPGADNGTTETGSPDPGTDGADATISSAIAAIDLAESDTGGVAYELDDEDDRSAWKIDVDVNGDNVEVHVDWDGTNVMGTEDDGSVDSDDVDRLATASVTLQDALTTASAEVQGELTGADLTTEDGTVVWEIEFDDDTEVYVDATTGSVITVDRG